MCVEQPLEKPVGLQKKKVGLSTIITERQRTKYKLSSTIEKGRLNILPSFWTKVGRTRCSAHKWPQLPIPELREPAIGPKTTLNTPEMY